MTRILHCSDFHFPQKITDDPSQIFLQFFSKRWIGNTNWHFSRKHHFSHDQLNQLPAFCKAESVETVIFTGDASITGTKKELENAAAFFEKIRAENIQILTLPGNHDHYTKKSFREKAFYNHFPDNPSSNYSLRNGGVEALPLSKDWYYVGLDTVRSTPPYSSRGDFTKRIEQQLQEVLRDLPDTPILMANHFPFLPFDHPRKILEKGNRLETIIANDPRIQIYIHGHTHRQCIADLREDNLALILDSGSGAHKHYGTFHLYDLQKNSIEITVYTTTKNMFSPIHNTRFFWS
ncbi:MAG: metallophosphoesterase [Chlamydiota bacterium]